MQTHEVCYKLRLILQYRVGLVNSETVQYVVRKAEERLLVVFHSVDFDLNVRRWQLLFNHLGRRRGRQLTDLHLLPNKTWMVRRGMQLISHSCSCAMPGPHFV